MAFQCIVSQTSVYPCASLLDFAVFSSSNSSDGSGFFSAASAVMSVARENSDSENSRHLQLN